MQGNPASIIKNRALEKRVESVKIVYDFMLDAGTGYVKSPPAQRHQQQVGHALKIVCKTGDLSAHRAFSRHHAAGQYFCV
jgi:hypothetical protein